MNRDEIIRMAREAGAWDYYEINGDKYSDYSPLEKFAVLVAAAERESMTKDGWRRCAVGQRTTQFCGMLEDAVKAEREALLSAVDEIERENRQFPVSCDVFRNAIRERGEQK